MINANVTNCVQRFARNVLPQMADQKFGRVVAIPGILGKAPMMQASAYCAAKYALTGMIKCLKDEYKRFGIRFSLMHFGGVDSSFWDNITMKVQRDKMLSVEAAAKAVLFCRNSRRRRRNGGNRLNAGIASACLRIKILSK